MKNGVRYWKSLVALCLIFLAALAFVGLHRDIQRSVNPCVLNTQDVECARYACGIGQYLPIPMSHQCQQVLANRGPHK